MESCGVDSLQSPASKGATDKPPRGYLRLRLHSMDDVKSELGRLYREGKSGRREVAEVSKLANVLSILGRLIEGVELARRVEQLEEEAKR